MDDKTVANLINELIGDHSRQEFSKKAGVKPMSITRWTNGTKINLVDFEKLCLAADRKVHEVLNFEGVTDTLQKEFNVPEEYSLSIKELLKELLELQQENYQSQNSDNFIKLFTRNIRETKETLRSMKAKPERWLSITDFTERIALNSTLSLVVPPDSCKETVDKYSALYQLEVNNKKYYCSYVTKGGGTTWSYLRSLSHRLLENKILIEDIKGIRPVASVWNKLWDKNFDEDIIPGEFISYEDKNLAFNSFLDFIDAYYKENSKKN
jgi:hypothetical protein